MYLALTLGLMLVFSLAVLFVAVNMYRRQRMLQEKKIEYRIFQRKNSLHWSLFRRAQANIEHTKTLCKNKESEMIALLQEVKLDQKEIKDTLEILKKEIIQEGKGIEGELERIIERRKAIIKERWTSMNGKKTAFLERRKELQDLMASVERKKLLKDQEYARWSETKEKMARIKKEYEQISKKPFPSLDKKKGK